MFVKVLFLVFFLFSCDGGRAVATNDAVMNENEKRPDVHQIGPFYVNLETDSAGKCVFRYSREELKSKDDSNAKKITLDLDSPCEFVRNSPKNKSVLSFGYGSGEDRYKAVIVVGGKPDPEKSDELMSGGCGTEFIAISVYDTEIIIGDRNNVGGGSICPARGLDEKYFGIYSKRRETQ